MDLITTHVNTDFDALSSAVAAKKLYPDAHIVLPGAQEQAVREFLALSRDSLGIETEKELNLAAVTRLIIVDTRHRSRIGTAGELVERGVTVHIYDHHPHMAGDIVADKEVYESLGATVTMLAMRIKKKRLPVTPLEATLMLLGIYEETGSLTFRTTTQADVEMVGFLLAKGADLSAVARYLNRELTQEELAFLARLIVATERMTINGITVALIEIASDAYVGELGMLIHKLMEVENIPVLFVIMALPHGRVNIIARSRLVTVDVNKILSHFGGGGHPSASFAKVQGTDRAAVRTRLVRFLKKHLTVHLHAREVMTRHIDAIAASTTVRQALARCVRAGREAAPVSNKRNIVGIITVHQLRQATERGFGHARVTGYMSRTVVHVSPTTPFHEVQALMGESDTGIIMVRQAKRISGIIRRQDVLRGTHYGLFPLPRPAPVHTENVAGKMASSFPPRILALVRHIGDLATRSGYRAFIVGGIVRDLLLGTKNLDLDIVIEGDAISLGRAVARELHAALIVHKRFGTCTVVTPAKLKIDLATARKEVYERPAALPTVAFSSLKDDLIRRDFTINAMAVAIGRDGFGNLIDFFGGQADLACGTIRVLHDGSFIDDPTRIFRAVRFEQRLGFTIEPHTEELIQHALKRKMFEKVQKQRLRDELLLIVQEKNPVKALMRMEELHEFRFIHPRIRFGNDMVRLFRAIDESCDWYESSQCCKRHIERWLVYLIALFERVSPAAVVRICNAFVFRRADRLRILSYKRCGRRVAVALAQRRVCAPSVIYRLLEPLSYEVIMLIMAHSRSVGARRRIKEFLTSFNGVHTHIRGDDLARLGLRPGPHFRTILEKVLYKKIDGALPTKEDEHAYVAQLMRQRKSS